MNDRDVDAEDIRREHQDAVHVSAHVVYLGGVLAGATVLMLLLLVLLDNLD